MTEREAGTWDYIIVGAGSAGCVLANRLSEDGRNSVLLVEAGGSDRSIFIRMPTALSYPMNMPRYNWFYETEPEPFANNRRFHCPRGKVIGGSSSINGMVYVRGHALDFDEWETLGAQGWGYRDCLPYFQRAETWIGGADDYHGGSGPLHVGAGNHMALNPLYQAFIDAGVEAGYPRAADYNGKQQEGFGPMHMSVRNGVRESCATAYLKPAQGRRNLSIIRDASVRKILVENGAATGIRFSGDNGKGVAHCNREVILCAGSIGSPAMLQHSGIGPAQVLRDAGVDVVHELPGVGANLQDHLEVYFQIECTQPITLNSRLNLFSKGLIGARWILFRDGLGATNHFESCGFIRSEAGIQWPDIQYHFLPAAMRYDGNAAFKGHGYQVHVGPNKPKSRGHVWIESPEPRDKPRILFNYLQDPADVATWRNCIHLTREVMAQPAFDPYRGSEIQPGESVGNNDEIDAWVRANVESAYHPAGTCRMGSANDAMAVVDPECRVIGVERLRVIDSSIMPTLTNGNLNAPTIMLAEKAADLVLGKAPLPGAAVEPWVDSQWRERQRPQPPKRSMSKA